jgi:DNA repair exonuclease SbcCD nuclease subunit
MKLLCTGDWHLRYKRPEMRLDENYFETQADKVIQHIDIARRKNCKMILQPGDFFDSVETPWFVVQYYMKMFLDNEIEIYTIPGQHDLRYHTRDIQNTPLGVLEASGCIKIVDEKMASNFLCGVWWGGDIPDGDVDILLMHRMIVQEKLWEGQENFNYANDLLLKYPKCNLFVIGDNHKSFVEEYQGRYLVNCGSLMRSSINQVDHKPVVYVYDTDKRDLEEIFLKVKPAKKVLNFDQAKVQKDRDERLDTFIEAVKSRKTDRQGSYRYDFVAQLYEVMKASKVSKGLYEVMKANKVSQGVIDIIEEALKGRK